MSTVCEHSPLTFSSSPTAIASGYRPYSNRQLLTVATGCTRTTSDVFTHDLNAFPAPLVLPGDDIEGDPTYPSQSFREWLDLGVRNHVTSGRNVLYVAAAPDIDSKVEHMQDWQCSDTEPNTPTVPGVESIVAYLRAFYHVMEVELLQQR
ncbi:hypothetical protein LTR10_017894 [Elasticomyces elasticus]|uniref:Uncharacterized protein n=1 Tax=Exophiala sideris TaxID=1016849 RepID=A0ABR0IWD7_9EURO|nr:hypothetical protein LTR10_017894 [Elasticomyces elasticus]KAK5021815.1 hypothetical protein LTS07_010710 [Exophiala sideris]KAK5025827.1 hypothetical protein LTR13_010290 [Exophiala sideris]KAK5050191.1 hypothetical protein LTR69_010678 [Exophiala sideris]KAK5177052.1 hypothetical protein LTR44_010489 [Eurotiomycetes sp. CCFEE 6388]